MFGRLSRVELRSRIAIAAIWLTLVLFLFPGVGSTLGAGLDPSWAYAINAVPHLDHLPGRDIVFTYGPLGWLLRPAAIGDNLSRVLLFRLAMHALFALALARGLRGIPIGQAFTFAAFYLVGQQLGLGEESRLLITLALLLAPELAEPRRVPWAPALAGALSLVFLLIKLNFGLSAAALVGMFCLLLLLRRKPRRRRAVLAAAAGFTVAVAVAVPLAFGSLGQALHWLGLEAEIVRGYASGMRLPAEPAELTAGMLALAVFAGAWLYAHRTGGSLADLWTMLLLPAWFAFQGGFIRADVHTGGFFPFLLGVVALGFLFARREPDLRATGAACLVLLSLAVPIALRSAGPVSQTRLNLALGVQGWRNLISALSPADLQRRTERVQRRQLRPQRLPAKFVKPVRAAGLGVDVLPWELSYLPANRLRWVPSPTLQLYATYTRRLDGLAARHFSGHEAPDLLLVEQAGIDGRDMLWDTPETWRAILAGYELDARRPVPNLLVLHRRPAVLRWQLARQGQVVAKAGDWIEVPAGGAWTFAEISLEPRWTGRLERLLLGVPPVFLRAVDGHGRHRTVRILPETAAGGLLMAPAPSNLDELAALWSGGNSAPRLVRFRLTGPGLRCFADGVSVRYLAGSLAAPPAAATMSR